MGFIVVGLDGSLTARAAFAEAVREAQWRDASLLAVHAVPLPAVMGTEFGAVIELDALRDAGEDFLATEMAELEARYEGGFPVPVNAISSLGHSGAEIIKAAQDGPDGPADMVVLGSRGLGGFKGLLLGSVTTYAVHHLTCPLLIVPAS